MEVKEQLSEYTVQLRYICQSLAGSNSISTSSVIEYAREKIFDFDYEIFDVNYRKILETKILRHYFLYEIGLETYELWKFQLENKFNEIMPYYNQLYITQLNKFDYFNNTNLTTTSNRKIKENDINDSTENGTNNTSNTENSKSVQNNSGSSTSKSNGTNESSTKRGYSDTPQGYMTNVEDANYLTNFTSENGDTTSDVTANDNFSNNSDITNNKNSNILNSTNNKKINISDKSSDDNYIENLKGNNGSKSYSELLMEYRNTLINIDMMIIDELADLFMGVW